MDWKDYSEQELQPLTSQLDLVAAEADAALTNQDARAASVESRAGLLTGAAAILGSVQATTHSTIWVYVLLGLSFLAAACGLYVVKPRWQKILFPQKIMPAVLGWTPLVAKYRVASEKVYIFIEREPGLNRRAIVVSVGYAILAASIVVSVIIAATPVAPPTTSG
ncbi:hypothetical protein [Leifsonia sp. C5G2]|uniref:hypothetical protein n=1 Tax=Leifsonia sp. C5G2 TaxID=2735269 RepID=UPI0015856C96|nr:hypothetical protein [Leifsonia sp. C5G2]NUU05417.1 hypothetical protein [Leifsonia sp. C5G2]